MRPDVRNLQDNLGLRNLQEHSYERARRRITGCPAARLPSGMFPFTLTLTLFLQLLKRENRTLSRRTYVPDESGKYN